MAGWMVIFGWCFIVAMIVAILVPYLLGKSDLLTSWNLFLLGSINFVGIGAIYSGGSIVRLAVYDDHDRELFLLGAMVCYAALFGSYYFLRFPRRAASRRLSAWPPFWGITVAVLIAVYALLVPFAIFALQVVGVGQVLVVAGTAAITLLVAVTFLLWLDRPLNAPLAAFFLVALVAGVFACMHLFSRRPLLSVALSLPICLYWLKLRYRNAGATLTLLAGLGLGAMVLTAGFSAIRGGKASATERLARLISSTENSSATSLLDGDVAVECSCIAIHYYTRVASPQPFFTIEYVLSNPIPRSLWPGKPEALGYTLPRDVGFWQKTGYVNWGPGIVGHGFHEGGEWFGLPMLVFYGILFGSLMRFFDDLLARQPNNPYLICTLAAASADIIAFSRGDIGYFSMALIGSVATGLVLPQILRLFTGTGFRYASDDSATPSFEVSSAPLEAEYA